MTQPIDTSPAALRSEAILHAGKCRSWAAKAFNDAPDATLCVGAGERLLYAAQLLDLLTLAAEKEAQAKHEPIEASIEAAYWSFDARRKGYGPWKETPMSERDAFKTEIRNAIFAQQHHPEQHLEMVAPADVPLPKVPFAWYWPSGCGKWFEVFVHAVAVKLMLPCGKTLYTADQLHQYAEAYAKAAVAAVYEQCARLCDEAHAAHVSVFGNFLGDSYAIKCKEAILANQKGMT